MKLKGRGGYTYEQNKPERWLDFKPSTERNAMLAAQEKRVRKGKKRLAALAVNLTYDESEPDSYDRVRVR